IRRRSLPVARLPWRRPRPEQAQPAQGEDGMGRGVVRPVRARPGDEDAGLAQTGRVNRQHHAQMKITSRAFHAETSALAIAYDLGCTKSAIAACTKGTAPKLSTVQFFRPW